MYKLIAIGGKIRGEEFEITESAVLGRSPDCDIYLDVNGVSKKHARFTVSGDKLYLEDLGSSNGTLVNGKMAQRATLVGGDKIVLPDIILQVVQIKEKKVFIKRKAEEEDSSGGYFIKPQSMPQTLFGKIIYWFKFKFMPVVHGINKEYEWRSMIGIILTLFILTTITITILPILKDSKNLLIYETAKRGSHYVDQIARQNARALEAKQLDKVDTDFLDNVQDVSSYELFDLEGRIVRPFARMNNYVSDSFSIASRDWATATGVEGNILRRGLGKGEIGIAKKIITHNNKTGLQEVVGVIALRFKPMSLQAEAQKNSKAYLEALASSAAVAIVFFGMIYFLTIRPVEEVIIQTEEVLRGRRKNIETVLLMGELSPLKSLLNSLLQKNKELSGEAQDDFESMEEDASYVETLSEFLRAVGGAAMVLDSEKRVKNINMDGEDVIGLRLSSSQNQPLVDVARERGFAATILELCDQSANSSGMCQEGEYELSGENYRIFANCLIGKDSFAKAYLLTFIKDS